MNPDTKGILTTEGAISAVATLAPVAATFLAKLDGWQTVALFAVGGIVASIYAWQRTGLKVAKVGVLPPAQS